MHSDYQNYLDEIARRRAEQASHECANGIHNWDHLYGFDRCYTCGEHATRAYPGGQDQ